MRDSSSSSVCLKSGKVITSDAAASGFEGFQYGDADVDAILVMLACLTPSFMLSLWASCCKVKQEVDRGSSLEAGFQFVTAG